MAPCDRALCHMSDAQFEFEFFSNRSNGNVCGNLKTVRNELRDCKNYGTVKISLLL